ncbi:DNA primase family protein [Lentilitoribacter sp. EG35]|uniref:DNA primase family protein n=1 Tax=Lentilitoribacter sp. EG35 TaxID=3234192 RepID=UPI00345F5A38
MSKKKEKLTPEQELEAQILEQCARYERDDIGNGERFRARFGDLVASPSRRQALRVAHIGWHIFNGQCYVEDEDERATRPLAHKAARAILDEIPLIKPTENEQQILDGGLVSDGLLSDMGSYDPKWDTKEKDIYQANKAQVDAADKVKASLKDRRASLKRHAKSSAGSNKINAMLTEAGPYLSVGVDQLNVDRHTINTASGLLTFKRIDADKIEDGERTWETHLTPHSPDNLVTKVVSHPVDMKYEFTPGEDCPDFEKFLTFVMPSQEMRDFLQRYMGLCLTGLVTEQCLLFFLGIGRNGKSTFVGLMSQILSEYAVTLSIDSFSGENRRGGAEATPDLARLPGARLVAASEPEEGVVLKEALIKTLTGGEKFPVRRLNKDFFEVDPQFKIILSGNHTPRIKNNDDGIWRRIHLVKWDVQVAESDVDKDLPNKLEAEAAGVFRWMIEGALDYLSFGLNPPDIVREATAEYRQESDSIGSFIRMACDVTGESHDEEKPADLYKAFEKYCDVEGDFKINQTAFNRKLAKATKLAFKSPDNKAVKFMKRKSSTTFYSGIKIKDDFRAFETTSSYKDKDQ